MIDFIRDFDIYEEVSAGGKDYLLVHAGLGNYDPKKEIEDWVTSNLRSFLLTFNLPINVLTNRDEDVKQFGKALFDEIRSVGFDEGYECAEVSAAENAEGF